MKIIKKLKISDFNHSFSVKGNKEDLLLFEKILQNNGREDDVGWNKVHRHFPNCTIIVVYSDMYTYFSPTSYLGNTHINVKDFL